MSDPTKRLWRTLIRVKHFYATLGGGTMLVLVVPGYDGEREEIRLEGSKVPNNILTRISEGQIRFHARANIGAESINDLTFEDWEER